MSIKQQVKITLFGHAHQPTRIVSGPGKGLRLSLDRTRSVQPWLGVYERAAQRWLAKVIPSGGTCIDVGAAQGLLTLVMARFAGAGGRVVAFEPGAEAPRIKSNLEMNPDARLSPVEIVPAGVSNHTSPDRTMLRLDDWAADNSMTRLDVLKIDVDGHEMAVLEGAAHLIDRHKPRMFVETHSPDLRKQVTSWLAERGYQPRIVKPPFWEHRPIEENVFVFA